MHKKIAPIIVTIIIIIFVVIQFSGIIATLFSVNSTFTFCIMLFFLICALSVIGAVLYTLYERIKEINKEDDDDLSKY